jgi:hypothetical protein
MGVAEVPREVVAVIQGLAIPEVAAAVIRSVAGVPVMGAAVLRQEVVAVIRSVAAAALVTAVMR